MGESSGDICGNTRKHRGSDVSGATVIAMSWFFLRLSTIRNRGGKGVGLRAMSDTLQYVLFCFVLFVSKRI